MRRSLREASLFLEVYNCEIPYFSTVLKYKDYYTVVTLLTLNFLLRFSFLLFYTHLKSHN